MSLNVASKEKPVENFLSSLIEAYPDASMRDIAVLFTDVVGSTSFFKTHGDIRGREMLRTHHTMAMSIVDDYGGSLIKEVGDSVLVYFPDPAEALKASITMQHRFSLHNRESAPDDQIHVRVGLHFGKVIVEEKDIYGDVVNVAAKLTNLAGGDQVFVSHELYDITKDLPSVQFERIDFWNMKNVPDGLCIYKVAWENSAVAAPVKKVLVVVVPDPRYPDVSCVLNVVDPPPQEKDASSDDRCLSVKRSGDAAAVFVYDKAPEAVDASRRMLAVLTDRTGAGDTGIPVKIYITTGSARDEKRILSQGPGPELEAVPYGCIYVTGEVCNEIQSHQVITGTATAVQFEAAGPLLRISGEGKAVESSAAAPAPPPANPSTQEALYPPCFYCGSGKHKAMDCPSRALTESGKSIEHLGYLPVQAIEELALSIEKSPGDIQAGPNPFSVESTPDRNELIAHAYYDLKCLYQLRFSLVVWNSNAASWEAMNSAVTENQGGFAWLAQDSLRVSNYDKARSFLKLALERKPQDYKVHCVSGFLNMEEENILAAIADFNKALEYAQNTPRKIYISLILARLQKLSGDRKKLKNILSGVFLLDGSCQEAMYEDILLRFEEGSEKPAIQKLVRLIGENRNFFVVALIDPELSAHRNTIYVHLIELLTEAKKEALSHFNEAKKELTKSRALLPLSALKSIDPVLLEIEALVQSESYFGCLDVPHRCSGIRTMCKNALNDQIHTIMEVIKGLKARFEKADAFIGAYRYSHLTQKHRRRLAYLKASLGQLNDVRYFESSGEFEHCYHVCQDISKELSSLESRLEMLDVSAQVIRMCLRFLKNSSIFFSIVFFLGIFVFPLISDHINAVLTRLDISLFPNAWSLQKSFLIFGGIVSLVVSFSITIREFFANENRAG